MGEDQMFIADLGLLGCTLIGLLLSFLGASNFNNERRFIGSALLGIGFALGAFGIFGIWIL